MIVQVPLKNMKTGPKIRQYQSKNNPKSRKKHGFGGLCGVAEGVLDPQAAKPSKTDLGALRGHSGGPSGTPLGGHLGAQVGLMLGILAIIFEVVFQDMLEEPFW